MKRVWVIKDIQKEEDTFTTMEDLMDTVDSYCQNSIGKDVRLELKVEKL